MDITLVLEMAIMCTRVSNFLASLAGPLQIARMTMDKGAKIFVAGHRGLVGAAIVRALKKDGYNNLVMKTHKELDLTRQADVEEFFNIEKPDYVILAAAKVGGIHANSTYPAEFIGVNLQIQTNVIDAAYRSGVKKLLFLGSSCIYPKFAQIPIKEESLLTGALEGTNEWYAVAKIAGIKMCQVGYLHSGLRFYGPIFSLYINHFENRLTIAISQILYRASIS